MSTIAYGRRSRCLECLGSCSSGRGEAVSEPGAGELRPGHAGFRIELDRLMAEVRPQAGSDALVADDRSRIARPVSRHPIENKRGLTAIKGDKRLRQKRRPRFLS